MEKFRAIKPVLQTLYDGTEIEFESISEASVKTGVSRTVISKMCNNKRTYRMWRDGCSFRFKHEWHITENLKIKKQ